MTLPLIWIILGIVLILSELIATSIIAVFLGIGALVTGSLLYIGAINSLAMQLWLFSGISLLSLMIARRRLKQFFVGGTIQKTNSLIFYNKP